MQHAINKMNSIMAVSNRHPGQDDRPSPAVPKAVLEMIRIFLQLGSGNPTILVSIKSKKKNKPSSSDMCFYIKVMSENRLEHDFYRELLPENYLLKLLTELERCDNECHLCVQHPHLVTEPVLRQEGQVEEQTGSHDNTTKLGCLQHNLKLKDGALTVYEESFKQTKKRTQHTVLYLRVHAPFIQMLMGCKVILESMCLIKIFRPQTFMSFSMHAEEVLSESDFSFSRGCWQNFAFLDFGVCTDAHFLLKHVFPRPSLTTHEFQTEVFSIGPEPVSVRVLNRENIYKSISIQLLCLGQYIPIEDTASSFVALVIYGPKLTPFELPASLEGSVLAHLNWKKFGYQACVQSTDSDVKRYQYNIQVTQCRKQREMEQFALPLYLIISKTDHSESSFKDFDEIQQNWSAILVEYEKSVINVLEAMLEKVLTPMQTRAKTRELVGKCIQCAGKAVCDIVTMSTNPEFRSQVLQLMQVDDSVDLLTSFTTKLTDLSKHKHAGVWRNSHPSSNWKKDNSSQDQATMSQSEVGTGFGAFTSTSDIINPADSSTATTMMPTENDPVYMYTGQLPFKDQLSLNSKTAYTKSQTESCDIHRNERTFSSQRHCSEEPQNISELDEHPNTAFDFLLSKSEDCIDTHSTATNAVKAHGMDSASQKKDQVSSPFQQLVDSPTTSVDLTPDIIQITAGMQHVSPFHLLAIDEKEEGIDVESLQEDPHVPSTPNTVINTGSNKNKALLSKNKLNDSTATASFKEYVQTFHRQDNKLETKSCRPCTNNKSPACVPQSPLQSGCASDCLTDFDLLESEDFKQTFTIVSELVDHVNNEGMDNCTASNGITNVAAGKCSTKPNVEHQSNSEDWFDDVLKEVENWLQ